jgi:hypothetical protein
MTSVLSPQHDSGSGARLASSPRRFRSGSAAALVALVAPALVVAAAGSAQAADPVLLGTAGGFSVLAGATITNTGPTHVWGDIGISPGLAITNTGILDVEGETRSDDGVTRQAKTDLTTAYTTASTTPAPEQGKAEYLGIKGGDSRYIPRLTPGVYSSGAGIDLTGTLTLDAEGRKDAVFIFKAVSDLITASGSVVKLEGGAQACNVFWQVGSSATLGTTTQFVGTVMADQSITLTNRAAVQGRVLARIAAVTMDENTITRPGCESDMTAGSGGAGGTGGSDASATASANAAGGSGQVRRVPRGSVDTGDGSSAAGSIPIRRLFSADDTVGAAAARLWR